MTRGSIDPARLRSLLQRLLDLYSPTGKEEKAVDYLHGRLRREGLPVIRQPVDERRANLLVLPRHVEADLVLLGHVDTVVAYDLEHYGFAEDGDRIRGLGAADMKGGLAAMVEAYSVAWHESSGRLASALAIVVGEEEYGDGAEQLTADYHFPWALIAEPTDLLPCLSNFGYIELQIAASGQRIHASLADRGSSPVEVVLSWLQGIVRHMEQAHPDMVLNIRDLLSSRAGFAVPERCEAWLDIHTPPDTSLEPLLDELDRLRPEPGEKVQNQMRFTTLMGGYALPEKGPLVDTLQRVFARQGLDWRPSAFRSHSDANLLWEAGTRPMLLGPGQLEAAHAPDESTSFEQVCTAAGLYLDLLRGMGEP